MADPEVVAVIDHTNAPRLRPAITADQHVLQSPTVAYRGQVVAAVVATTIEAAREGAEQVLVRYAEHPHEVVLDPDDPDLELPETTNAGFPGTSVKGDVDAALAAADVVVDHVYTTPPEHNNPMETVATIARWDGDRLLRPRLQPGTVDGGDRLRHALGHPAGAGRGDHRARRRRLRQQGLADPRVPCWPRSPPGSPAGPAS